jgi:hypothetical protein
MYTSAVQQHLRPIIPPLRLTCVAEMDAEGVLVRDPLAVTLPVFDPEAVCDATTAE